MNGRKYAGAVLVILGGVFLVGNLTGTDLSLWKWWPALLIAAGLLSVSNGDWKGGLIVVGIFSTILLSNLGVWNIDISRIWPVILIALGLAMFFGIRHSHRAKAADARENLNVGNVFASSSQQAGGEGFTGGDVSATFGSTEVDLSSAEVIDGTATINATVLFGSVNLRVPPDWAVEVRASVTFGHIESKRQEPAEPTARLVIMGSCTFGAIEITS